MENKEEAVKFNVRALAANEKVSVEKLAEMCELDPVHLRNVSLGRAEMSAKEIIHLSTVTGVSPFQIKF